MSEKLPDSLDAWIEFMDGYRDPKSMEELRKQYGKDADWERTLNLFLGSSGAGARECGNRKEGGTYATCPLSPYGKPLEHFVTCLPVPIVADDYNLSNVGVKLVNIEEVCLKCNGEQPKRGKDKYVKACPACDGSGTETVTHVFDIVGQEYYPNVADFLEEARRMGVSRRLELEDSRQYARLSSRSRLMLLHQRAVIDNPRQLLRNMEGVERQRLERAGCPKGLEHNYKAKDSIGCSALHWHTLTKGVPVDAEAFGYAGFVERQLVSGSYRGYSDLRDIRFRLGIFAVFPLVKIQVVDPDGSYEDRVERAGTARLDVEAVEC